MNDSDEAETKTVVEIERGAEKGYLWCRLATYCFKWLVTTDICAETGRDDLLHMYRDGQLGVGTPSRTVKIECLIQQGRSL